MVEIEGKRGYLHDRVTTCTLGGMAGASIRTEHIVRD
jgi:hypothetical protein